MVRIRGKVKKKICPNCAGQLVSPRANVYAGRGGPARGIWALCGAGLCGAGRPALPPLIFLE